MASDSLDFTKDIHEILGDVSKIFSQDSQEIVSQKIFELTNYVDQILKLLKEATMSKQGSRNPARKNLTPIMKNAYQLIMEFRTALLGEKEEIKYRLYVRGEKISDTYVIDIPESKLMELVERSGNTLRLKRILDDSLRAFQNSNLQSIFDEHFQTIFAHFIQVKKNNFVVPFYNVSDLFGVRTSAPNLYWQEDTTKGKSAYTPKMFNRGWIFQAFDATVYDLYSDINLEEVNSINESRFREIYFKKNLAYDNVIGFKGGDVGLNQIKSNAANLMSAHSLIEYLENIQIILNPNNYKGEGTITDFIKSKFLEKTPAINSSVSQTVDNNVKTLLAITSSATS